MDQLPEDVSLSLLRGVAAYIRATPTQELPAKVRRFQNFRASALGRHKNALLSLIEDDISRTRIIEWLDEEKTSLSKDDAAVLRLAAAREDGWKEALTERSQLADAPAAELPTTASADAGALQREKAKVRKAKDELKRARHEAERELKTERARITKLEKELGSVTAALEKAHAAAEAEARRAVAAIEKADREIRRARKGADQANKVAEEARNEVRALRKEITELARQLKERSAPRKKAKRKTTATTTPARPRRPLPAPKGRLEDAPETLEEWLVAEHVHLVVDGYNVTKAEGGFGDLELEKQRDRLIQEVGKLTRKKGIKSTVVFDGSKVPPGTSKLNRGPARVEFSIEETADDHIVALLDGLPQHPIVVATNDRELQGRARAKGATVATSNQLLSLLR